ncbi:hypothetical protein GN156_08455 [bacterium LRH843]|nr:hypothetical protein [bacterium LRH843]
MNKLFIRKQIQAVSKSYTDMELGLPLSVQEEQYLLLQIMKRLECEKNSTVCDIFHDIVYTFFNGQGD